VDDLHRLAHDTVAWFLNDWTPRPDDYAALELAEVVEMDSGGPGVMLMWIQTTRDQGQRKFGFLMGIPELLHVRPAEPGQSLSADQWLPELALAIVEPQGTPASAAVRTWFRHIP
jgi:ABC-type transporter Mla MlaB component